MRKIRKIKLINLLLLIVVITLIWGCSCKENIELTNTTNNHKYIISQENSLDEIVCVQDTLIIDCPYNYGEDIIDNYYKEGTIYYVIKNG